MNKWNVQKAGVRVSARNSTVKLGFCVHLPKSAKAVLGQIQPITVAESRAFLFRPLGTRAAINHKESRNVCFVNWPARFVTQRSQGAGSSTVNG